MGNADFGPRATNPQRNLDSKYDRDRDPTDDWNYIGWSYTVIQSRAINECQKRQHRHWVRDADKRFLAAKGLPHGKGLGWQQSKANAIK